MHRTIITVLLSCFAASASAQVFKCPGGGPSEYREQACAGGEKITLDSPIEKLRANAVQVYLYSQSKGCVDTSTVLLHEVAGKKPQARTPDDRKVAEDFRRQCESAGFRFPRTAEIHRANQRLHEEHKARLMKALDAAGPARR